jgi:hypothetical protein
LFTQGLLTSNTPTITGQPYGNGLWNMSASSVYTDYPAFRAFNLNPGDFWSSGDFYSNGTYTGTATMPLANGTGVRGEWIQIVLPEDAMVTAYSLQGRQESGLWQGRMPRDFVLLGSRTGATWNVIDTRTGVTFTWASSYFTSAAVPVPYSRYRLVAQTVGTLGASFNTQIDMATFILRLLPLSPLLSRTRRLQCSP